MRCVMADVAAPKEKKKWWGHHVYAEDGLHLLYGAGTLNMINAGEDDKLKDIRLKLYLIVLFEPTASWLSRGINFGVTGDSEWRYVYSMPRASG